MQSTMYGIFFEDINFGADGGLYAEMVENRSFEFPNRLMGWNTWGNVSVSSIKPAFDRNPNYVVLEPSGHREKSTGIENHGFFGMGLKKDMKYNFSVYGRLHLLNGKQAKIRVELVDENNNPMERKSITITNNKWQKYSVELTSKQTLQKGYMRIFLEGNESVDLDHVSMFPEDNWNGLRADLVKDLEDLHPGIFRFPGGCIVEGTDPKLAINGKTLLAHQKTVRSTRIAGTTPSLIVCILTTIRPTDSDSMSISSFLKRLAQSHYLFCL